LVGNLATENDAARLKRATPNVRQITTGTICHLDAQIIEKHSKDGSSTLWIFSLLRTSAISSCPSSYDLGEELRFVMFSATEGEDKPLKYPTIFNSSDVAIFTKMDLAEAAEFDVAAARRNIENVRPGMQIFEVLACSASSKSRAINSPILARPVRHCGSRPPNDLRSNSR
jgi:hydrogenase nickel incorporation protein HypB